VGSNRRIANELPQPFRNLGRKGQATASSQGRGERCSLAAKLRFLALFTFPHSTDKPWEVRGKKKTLTSKEGVFPNIETWRGRKQLIPMSREGKASASA